MKLSSIGFVLILKKDQSEHYSI